MELKEVYAVSKDNFLASLINLDKIKNFNVEQMAFRGNAFIDVDNFSLAYGTTDNPHEPYIQVSGVITNIDNIIPLTEDFAFDDNDLSPSISDKEFEFLQKTGRVILARNNIDLNITKVFYDEDDLIEQGNNILHASILLSREELAKACLLGLFGVEMPSKKTSHDYKFGYEIFEEVNFGSKSTIFTQNKLDFDVEGVLTHIIDTELYFYEIKNLHSIVTNTEQGYYITDFIKPLDTSDNCKNIYNYYRSMGKDDYIDFEALYGSDYISDKDKFDRIKDKTNTNERYNNLINEINKIRENLTSTKREKTYKKVVEKSALNAEYRKQLDDLFIKQNGDVIDLQQISKGKSLWELTKEGIVSNDNEFGENIAILTEKQGITEEIEKEKGEYITEVRNENVSEKELKKVLENQANNKALFSQINALKEKMDSIELNERVEKNNGKTNYDKK